MQPSWCSNLGSSIPAYYMNVQEQAKSCTLLIFISWYRRSELLQLLRLCIFLKYYPATAMTSIGHPLDVPADIHGHPFDVLWTSLACPNVPLVDIHWMSYSGLHMDAQTSPCGHPLDVLLWTSHGCPNVDINWMSFPGFGKEGYQALNFFHLFHQHLGEQIIKIPISQILYSIYWGPFSPGGFLEYVWSTTNSCR